MTRIETLYHSLEYGPAPESPAPALEWLERHGRRFGHFIDGRWTDAGTRFATRAPADGSELAQVTQGSDQDVDGAVQAARAAQVSWARLDGHARARHLYALGRAVQRNARLFAVLESLDNGKPIREARDVDVPLVARHFLHHAGWAQLAPRVLPGFGPVGVVGQIVPWNFPLLMLAWKVAPALAVGNTVVLKPAEHTPLTALLFADLCVEVGIPAGVFNVVTGDGTTGAALVRHPDVDKIAFTGSTEVGRAIRVETAGSGKRLSLELGGKSPFVVFEDADLDSVVEGVVDAIWFNQGQVCCAGSRILVQEGVERTLERKLKARMETLRMGDPLDKSVDMGAIVAPVQLDRIRDLVERGRQEGAEIWQPSWAVPREGWFYPPTLCTAVAPAGTLAQVEIFGPVVVLMSFRTPDEAVELANDTRYGLAASVWTENVNLALDVAPRIQAGTVWINCSNQFDAASGFGGYRESGFGREGGLEGLYEYLAPRERGREPARSAADRPRLPRPAPDPLGGGPESIDRTAKLYIGGKQVRPDGETSLAILDAKGRALAEVPRANRKDVRNAVEAAHAALPGWRGRTAHNRAQILYYLAENLEVRAQELSERLRAGGASRRDARREVAASVDRLFTWAAWADKWDGRVHATPFRNVTLAMPEPLGVLGIVCPDEAPLLGFLSCVAPGLAMGNTLVAVPSEPFPLLATDVVQVLETSDVPAGVVNVLTGFKDELAPVLAAHDDVAGLWYFGHREGSQEVERLSAGNLKRTWVDHGRSREWTGPSGADEEFLREATQIKNIWVPYGE
ncbi:MAG: aldehyde dehydrogenase family protein [Gemmatimonadota bacterium]